MDSAAAVIKIKSALQRVRDTAWDLGSYQAQRVNQARTLALATISAFSPLDSEFRQRADEIIRADGNYDSELEALVGILEALQDAYELGLMDEIESIIAREVFADFLEMAEHFHEAGYKEPAAVLAGSVMEERLRALCERASIELELDNGKPRSADSMNAELARASVYGKTTQKQVTAWLDVRNQAAHGHHSEYDDRTVTVMLQYVALFLDQHPA